MRERFVVREQGKITTFQEETEVTQGGVGSQELSVKSGLTEFGREQLLGEEASRAQEPQTSW